VSKASLGAGDVQIVLDGETVTLRPSLKAALTISREAGGIMGAFRGLSDLNLDTVIGIIAVGLGKKPADIEEAVWRTGVGSLVPGVTQFVSIIANGGKPVDGSDGGSEKGNPQSE
jgi:hypothetical protein